MKNIYPEYPCFPDAFISSYDCQVMTLEQFGAYNWLLMRSWVFSDNPCHLPNDLKILAFLLRIDEKQMTAIWDAINKKFDITECGKFIYNHRLLSEYNKLVARSNIYRNNKLGHFKKKRKEKKNNSKPIVPQADNDNDSDIDYDNEDEEALIKSYLEYRKDINKPFKSDKSIKAMIEHLKSLGNGNIEKMRAIVQQSIANQWQGLFELKGTEKQKPVPNLRVL